MRNAGLAPPLTPLQTPPLGRPAHNQPQPLPSSKGSRARALERGAGRGPRSMLRSALPRPLIDWTCPRADSPPHS
eukprot:scaffold269512_cov31-Tisochrysis_lutea.AAC.8